MEALADPALDLRTIEKDKVKGAVRTDFILSAEIVAITLGTSLLSLPSLTPLAFSETQVPATHSAGAPPTGASWQVTLMSGRW